MLAYFDFLCFRAGNSNVFYFSGDVCECVMAEGLINVGQLVCSVYTPSWTFLYSFCCHGGGFFFGILKQYSSWKGGLHYYMGDAECFWARQFNVDVFWGIS